MCGHGAYDALMCTAAYVLSRLCIEPAYVRSLLMCGHGAYDALMYRAAYVLRRLCTEPLMCQAA
jgi:hypothetical protein